MKVPQLLPPKGVQLGLGHVPGGRALRHIPARGELRPRVLRKGQGGGGGIVRKAAYVHPILYQVPHGVVEERLGVHRVEEHPVGHNVQIDAHSVFPGAYHGLGGEGFFLPVFLGGGVDRRVAQLVVPGHVASLAAGGQPAWGSGHVDDRDVRAVLVAREGRLPQRPGAVIDNAAGKVCGGEKGGGPPLLVSKQIGDFAGGQLSAGGIFRRGGLHCAHILGIVEDIGRIVSAFRLPAADALCGNPFFQNLLEHIGGEILGVFRCVKGAWKVVMAIDGLDGDTKGPVALQQEPQAIVGGCVAVADFAANRSTCG